MAGSITFTLENPPSKITKRKRTISETPVNLIFWYDQIRIKVSTGERIRPKHWNKETRRARETQDFPESGNFNTRLENHERNVMATAREHLNQHGKIIITVLRQEIKNVLRPKPQKEPEQRTFLQAIQDYIDSRGQKIGEKKIVSLIADINMPTLICS